MRNAVKKAHIALFTPLPPAKTGTADYGASLAAALEKIVPLKVYERVPAGFDPSGFRHVLYQIGNNDYHTDIYELALRTPGIVVLHEASVHYLVRGLTVSRGDHKGYLREVIYEIFGQELNYFERKYLPIESPQPHEFTMLRRLLENSRACIVHSHYAERLVRLKGFRGPVWVVPHGADVRTVDSAKFRLSLNLNTDTPLIGVFGYQRPDKQIWECLFMFRKLLDGLPEARLLILGERHPQVPLEEGIRDLGLERRVILRGHQTLDDFDGYLGACTCVLNLRQTTFGETSGTMMRAFGLGRPVIMADIGAAHELPDDICIKVPRDRYEMRVINECLRWLVSHPSEAVEIGERARQWVATECTWDRAAQRYAALLEQPLPRTGSVAKPGSVDATRAGGTPELSAASIACYLSRWIDPASPAGTYFASHSVRLVRTLQLVPPGDRDSRILELGCYMQTTPALRGLLGYGEVRGAYKGNAGDWHRSSVTATDGEVFACTIDLFNVEVDRFPYADNYFDTVLCCELLEHLERDPMHMMSELHRVLKPDGTLILTTPNAVSFRALRSILLGVHPNLFSKYVIPTVMAETRHAREYTPTELLLLFTDAGFTTQYIYTAPYAERVGKYRLATKLIAAFKSLTRLREDCVYLVGRKSNAVASRYPAWLYEQL